MVERDLDAYENKRNIDTTEYEKMTLLRARAITGVD